jgi:ectoine hydroxylase-related dioxygenase (phytanoyl-CoA dioxygenase family)
VAAPESSPHPLRDPGLPAPGGLRLAAAERRAWQEDGFFVRRDAFTAAEAEELRGAAERVVRRAAAACECPAERWEVDGNVYVEACGATVQLEHRPGSHTLRVVEPFHHLDPRFEALVDDPRLVEPMRELVGSERVALFTDKLNLKRPGEGSRFRWHQDSPYWAHFCRHLDRLPNVLVALDDADEANGCLRVVRGTHRRGLLPGCQGEGRLGPLFTDPRCFDPAQQVPVVMPAGSLVFFHPHSVHGSEPNGSARERRALVLTYQPAGLRQFKVDAVREAGGA